MGKKIEKSMRVKVLPMHAYHPNASLMMHRQQCYVAVPVKAEKEM